jgi:hypothetical protein
MRKVQISTDIIINILTIWILKCRCIGIVLLFSTICQVQKMHADNKGALARKVYVAHGSGREVTDNYEVL